MICLELYPLSIRIWAVSKIFTRNNTKTLRDFWIKTVNVEGMNFILINPYNFPVVHPPYGYFAHPPKNY